MTTTQERGQGFASPADMSSDNRLQADRAVFDRIRAKHRDAPPRDDSIASDIRNLASQGAESAEARPEPEQAEEPQQSQAPAQTPGETKEPSPERQAAEQFLRLKTGSPQSVFDSMTEDAVLAWAEERRGREATVDVAFASAAETKRELERLRTLIDEKVAEPKGPTADELAAEATKALKDELSLTDEGLAALDKIVEARLAPLQAELKQRDDRAQQEQAQRTKRAIDEARGGLAKRFGGLADDTTFLKVFDDMQRLEDSPRFGGSGRPVEDWIPELMTAAARMHGLEEQQNEVEAARQAAEEDRRDRAAGTVQTGGQGNTQRRAKTKMELDRAVYDAIRKKHRQDKWAVG